MHERSEQCQCKEKRISKCRFVTHASQRLFNNICQEPSVTILLSQFRLPSFSEEAYHKQLYNYYIQRHIEHSRLSEKKKAQSVNIFTALILNETFTNDSLQLTKLAYPLPVPMPKIPQRKL